MLEENGAPSSLEIVPSQIGVYRIAFYKIRPEPDLPDFLH